MRDDQWGIMTRRAAIALLASLCLGTASPGCSSAGQASRGAAGIPDRLKNMRARSGTGDPRRRAKWSSVPARQRCRPG
jgi:hypothetical protein